jgi:hypothetical protein
MSLRVIHAGLANSASLFLIVLTLWALVQFLRTRPLAASWYGAAVVVELLLVGQAIVGGILWATQGFVVSQRPWIHILYGVVAVITLPAAYSYFSRIEDARVQTLAMTLSCAFLWGIVQRSAQVITMQLPY